MIRPRALFAALLTVGTVAAPARAALLYGTDGAAGSLPTSLYILNPDTGGVVSTVGTINVRIAGLAFDPATGVLYGSTAGRGTASTRSLVRIDPETAAVTVVGPFGLTSGTLSGLAFGPGGVLYGWGGAAAGSNLFTVDLATGAATQVGDSGLFAPGGALTFGPSGTLYLAGNATGPLYTVDPVTGVGAVGPDLTGAPLPAGFFTELEFDPAGTLFGINYEPRFGGPAFLVTIDPATGVVTSRGPAPAGLAAFAFRPDGPGPGPGPGPAVPEPASLTLLGLAAAGLAGYGRARRRA